MTETIYSFNATTTDGRNVPLENFRGQVLLVVNTASKCGFTPQYEGLEELYKKYGKRGFVILGFPCNQFAHQEPGTNEEIAQFCLINYGVTFPVMARIDVNGSDAHPIFKYLKKKSRSLFGRSIKWNFTKFLISRDGTSIERFAPATKPSALESAIEKRLEQ